MTIRNGSFAAIVTGMTFCQAVAWGISVTGRVYLDVNANGLPDAGEPGVSRVAVSDGAKVVVTDVSGAYRLEIPETSALVWISRSSGHAVSGAFWRFTDGSGTVDFGLTAQEQTSDFTFMQITDAHIGAADKVKRLGDSVGRLPFKIDFLVNTGDLLGDAQGVPPDKASEPYKLALETMRSFRLPQFHVPGNHEHVAFLVKDADTGHPNYGKRLYRKLLGPTYYSWDWAGVHFIALDGTMLQQDRHYQERLGEVQLGWLRQDLNLLPADKPVILFCHQVIADLRDANELAEILRGSKVLGAFCGHIHTNYTVPFLDFTVYVSGALSGAWWSAPNFDGTPQGYRLIRIKGGSMKTVYTNRDVFSPVAIISPRASDVVSGYVEAEAAVVDFGQTCTVKAEFSGQPVAMRQISREELWSFWRGTVDTRLTNDGICALKMAVNRDVSPDGYEVRYLVENGKREPFLAKGPAVLVLQTRGIRENIEVLLNGKALGTIPAGTTNETQLTFSVSPELLQRMNRVTLRGPKQTTARYSVGPVWLAYQGKKIYDPRSAAFERYRIGGGELCEKVIYHVLP